MNVSNELPKGWPGEYSTTFCTSAGIAAAQSDWLIWQLTTSWTCTGLPYYSSHFYKTQITSNSLKSSKQLQRLIFQWNPQRPRKIICDPLQLKMEHPATYHHSSMQADLPSSEALASQVLSLSLKLIKFCTHSLSRTSKSLITFPPTTSLYTTS